MFICISFLIVHCFEQNNVIALYKLNIIIIMDGMSDIVGWVAHR